MSKIEFSCANCQAVLRVSAPMAGKRGQCPECQTAFVVPGGQANPNIAAGAANPTNPMNPYSGPVNQAPELGYQKEPAYYSNETPSLGLMRVPLIISGVLYLLFGLAAIAFIVFALGSGPGQNGEAVFVSVFGGFMALICIGLALFIFLVVSQLPKRKKWAWIAAIVLGALYTPTAFIFLGVPILIGCFKQDVMNWYTGQ